MTTPPPMPDQPPTPPVKTRRRIPAAIGIGAALVAAVVGGILIGSIADSGSADSKSSPTVSATPADSSPVEAFTEAEAEPVYTEPDADDFTIELKTMSKKCYGYGVGCNVTVEPELSYLGLTENIDPSATIDITYEITGDENGPITETLTVSNRDDVTFHKTFLSTASSGTEIKAEITDVTAY